MLEGSWGSVVGVLLAALPAVLNVGILLQVLRSRSDSRLARTFVLFVGTLVAWQAFDIAVRATAVAPTAAMWRDLLRAGQFFAIATGLHFALRFARWHRISEHPATLLAIYAPPFIAQAVYAAGLIDERLQYVPVWGWIADTQLGLLHALVTTGFGIMAALIPAVLYAHMWEVRGQPLRFPTARTLAIGITVPVVVGLITEVALPLVGVQQIPLTSTTLSAFSLAAALSLRRTMLDIDTITAARTVIDAISDTLLIFDADGRLRFANTLAREQFNVGQEARNHVDELFRSGYEAASFRNGPFRDALQGARRYGLEMTLVDRNHQDIPVIVSLSALRHAGTVGAVLLVHDISEFKAVEAELAMARERVEQVKGAEGPWLVHLEEELRGPLNTILGLAELPHTSENAEWARIAAEGQALLRLVSDIIDLSRIDAGELSLSPATVELSTVVKEQVPICRELLSAQRNRLEVLTPLEVRAVGDPTRIRQVVLGVVAFAARVSRDGTVRVVVRGEHPYARVEIVMNKVTLDARQLESALSRAPRAGTERSVRLSLTLCRRLCQLMGGDVTASSDADKGTTFTILVPLAPESS